MMELIEVGLVTALRCCLRTEDFIFGVEGVGDPGGVGDVASFVRGGGGCNGGGRA
jgi:hypothetical protein